MTVSNIAATGFNPQSPMTTLGNLVNLGTAQQGLQQQQIQTQVAQQANAERQKVMQLMQTDPRARPTADGTFDTGYLSQMLPLVAPQTWAEQLQRIAKTNDDVRTANQGQLTYNQQQQGQIADILKENYNQPVSAISKNLDDAVEQYPQLQSRVDMIRHQLSNVDPTNQGGINAILAHNVGITQTLQQQLALQTGQKELKTPTLASTGGQLISTSPEFATGIPQFSPVAKMTLPPNTTVVNKLGGKSYLGDNSIQAELPPGVPQAMVGSAEEMNRHYASLNDQSTGSQLVAALSGNIQSLAQKAITGTEQDKKAYVNGMLNALNIGNQATGDLQKDTDLLEKSLAQLNLSTPASTDAARILSSIAKPHATMAAAAIPEATQQVASQVEANMALRNYLTPYRMANNGAGDVVGYQHAREQGENTFDPRIWQYKDMKKTNPDAARKFLTSQPDMADLIQKSKQLVGMGVIQ